MEMFAAAIPGADGKATLMWDYFRHDHRTTGDGWWIDVPSVLAILRAGAGGEAILNMIASLGEKSGCCPACDAAIGAYAEALALYAKTLADIGNEEPGISAETHPYAVTSAKAHNWNCSSARPFPHQVEHPGETLQQFAHTSMIMYEGYRPAITKATRMTPSQLREWLSGVDTAKVRCKNCQPTLPGAFASETSDRASTR